jgi:carbon monoxide dehydrogenase subunit G
VGTATATRELLAPRDDVWAFVSTPGRLADWWPGVFAAQADGDHWTIEGDERAGLTRVASPGDDEREETVHVVLNPPSSLELRFERSGYHVHVALEATGAERTTATLTIERQDPEETVAERLEEVVGLALTGPDDAFAESILNRLYELCQTGADA